MPKNIIIYTLPTCPHCMAAKKFLKDNNIVFKNKDVGQDKTVAMEMIRKTNQKSVPVLDIDGKLIIGFQKDIISKELGIK